MEGCRNQAAGLFIVGDQRWPICEDDWLDCFSHDVPDPLAAHMVGGMGWEPLLPDPVRAAIDRRLVALGSGAFG
jgi:hypothetical protein